MAKQRIKSWNPRRTPPPRLASTAGWTMAICALLTMAASSQDRPVESSGSSRSVLRRVPAASAKPAKLTPRGCDDTATVSLHDEVQPATRQPPLTQRMGVAPPRIQPTGAKPLLRRVGGARESTAQNVSASDLPAAIRPASKVIVHLPEPPESFVSAERSAFRHAEPDLDDDKPIHSLTTNVLPSRGELPANYAAARFEKLGEEFHTCGTSRPWMELTYFWEATSFCHGPLYFEEPNAERLGHTAGLFQPALTGAHFFARIPLLPYMATAEPPCECIYTLGHYRPGSCAPFRYIRLPLNLKAAAVQAGVVTGLVYLIP